MRIFQNTNNIIKLKKIGINNFVNMLINKKLKKIFPHS